MTGKNKYSRCTKISEKNLRTIVKLFALDLHTKQIVELVQLNRNTVNHYVKALRQKIAQFYELESPFPVYIEVDESWFGAKRVKWKPGRGASEKTMVFGIFKRNGKVYTEIVLNGSRAILQTVNSR